jgi:hypothetical protein
VLNLGSPTLNEDNFRLRAGGCKELQEGSGLTLLHFTNLVAEIF